MNFDTSTLKSLSTLANRLSDPSVLTDILMMHDIIDERPVLVDYNELKVVDSINDTTLRVKLNVTLDDRELDTTILVNFKEPYNDSVYYHFINTNLL